MHPQFLIIQRGRKTNVSSDIIINTIKYKTDILINNKVLSKTASIWQKVSEELSNYGQIKASFYTFVTCDKYNLHKLLGIKSCKTYVCNKNQNESI